MKTMMEEQLGIRSDLIEHQLGHAVKEATGEAYNRTKFLVQRREMMQQWADYLYQLLEGYVPSTNNVTIFRREVSSRDS